MQTTQTEIEDSLKVMFSEDLWDGLLVEIEVAKAKLRLKFELESGLNDAGVSAVGIHSTLNTAARLKVCRPFP